MEPLDDEMDVGLEWPQKLKTLPSKLLDELKSEKIELMKETLIYLQASVRGTWTEDDDKKKWESATLYKKACILIPIPVFPFQLPYTTS
jgi:hypothetical protein